MPIYFTSRELSERVEKDAQKHANRFRRRTWWATLWLSIGCVGWLTLKGAQGEYEIFEGGKVANPHRFIENDCAKCHTTWAPLKRFVSLDFWGDIHSVENKACEECHPGATHHDNQFPKHEETSCSFCHLEHIGEHNLKRVADLTCTHCHRKLEKHFIASEKLPAPSYVDSVTEFGNSNGHPEFAVRRLMQVKPSDKASPDALPTDPLERIGSSHSVLKLVDWAQVPESSDSNNKTGPAQFAWRDRTKLKFNHARHLTVVNGANGPNFQILERLNLDATKLGFNPQDLVDGTQLCSTCHKVDATGRYMQPINFEQHCHQCHKLWFDGDNEVPHATPEVVRGHLTDYFTLAIHEDPSRFKLDRQDRSPPGRQQRPRLTTAEAETVKSSVSQIEAALKGAVSDAEEAVRRRENGVRSGCAKCHTMEEKAQKTGMTWAITPTQIPSRWQPHAVFSHQSHQLLNCAECHGLSDQAANAQQAHLPQPGVFQSHSSGDVLLPGVALCQKCHSATPEQPAGSVGARLFGARTDCVECHNYHDHSKDKFVGLQNPSLGVSRVKLDAILKPVPNDK
jgi:hypothetical protein